MKTVYFPNLNGLRFIAAFMVIISHIEQFQSVLKLDSYWGVEGVHNLGKLGVYLFFVLSGFLITYLLLHEENISGTISVKNFYIRRILRIWPLYMLIVVLGFFVLPHLSLWFVPDWSPTLQHDFWKKFTLFFLFFSNLAFAIYPAEPVSSISQSWSVSTEEQFYLIWPVLMKFFKNKLRLLIGVIAVYWSIKVSVLMMQHFAPSLNNFLALATISNYLEMFCIDAMAIGGLGAYFIFHKKEWFTKIVFNRWVEIAALLVVLFFVVTGYKGIKSIRIETYAVFFGIIIFNAACNPKTIFKLENKMLSYLGKISYGLYMYHSIIIPAVINLGIQQGWTSRFFFYPACILLIIAVASISYEFFEKPILKRKLNFSTILSGEDAKK
jgi:peptidoglycan/LPS O-acetylase OafA/YrhL